MVASHWQRRLLITFLSFVTTVTTSAVAQTITQTAPATDPVLALIATSDGHFKAGQSELAQGHFEAAKQQFDQAIEVLLESPYGGRTEPRIREHFDRLVDRISAYEVRALATGDGFTEKPSEPAFIDRVLSMSPLFGLPLPSLHPQDAGEAAPHRIAIDPNNPRVRSYIELYQGRLHDFIEDGLQRGSAYLPMIQSVFRSEGLPLDLAYVPLVESAFKPNALSRVQAKGVWQFMTGTAEENGLRRDWYIDERSDPEKATVAAAKYLRTLSNIFDGDWQLALASYNGGPGRVQRALKSAHLNDFWSLSAKPRLLPHETREYVPMILAAIVIARNPGQYGFTLKPQPLPNVEKIELPRPVDLRYIAEWTGTTIDDIQSLNPELRRWTTPVKDSQYELKVPAGTGDAVRERLTEDASSDLAALKYYTVKRGDSLPVIAKKLRVNKTDLAEANYLPATTRVAAGQRLVVPHEATVLLAADTERPVPVADARTTVSETGTLAEATTSNRVRTLYQVKRGDTLSSIAQSFKTSVASLRTWNPHLPGDQLTAGQRLTVYRLSN